MRSFPLAPMGGALKVMTWVVLALPLLFLVPLLLGRPAALALPGVAMLGLFAWVWTWYRPSAFELDGRELRIRFPLRTRTTPRSAMRSAAPTTFEALRGRYGTLLRVGAGGLWGGFGRLWSRKGSIEFWISRTDGLVFIEREGMLPLLISPADPEAFLEALALGGSDPDT